MKNWILYLFLILPIGIPAWADEEKKPEPKKEEIKPEEKKSEEKKAEEPLSEENNPLPKILDLMREVESRLNDYDDADENVQNNQRKMVEAMKFGNKAKTALDDLIDKIEKQAEEDSAKQQNQDSENQQKNNDQPKPKERDQAQMERDKKEEEKRTGSNPMPDKKNNPSEKTANNKKDKNKSNSNDPSKVKNNPDKDSEQWGNLPAKLHEDAQKARSVKVPEKWRKQIEDYRQATAD